MPMMILLAGLHGIYNFVSLTNNVEILLVALFIMMQTLKIIWQVPMAISLDESVLFSQTSVALDCAYMLGSPVVDLLAFFGSAVIMMHNTIIGLSVLLFMNLITFIASAQYICRRIE